MSASTEEVLQPAKWVRSRWRRFGNYRRRRYDADPYQITPRGLHTGERIF
jgi:hypothetical protein